MTTITKRRCWFEAGFIWILCSFAILILLSGCSDSDSSSSADNYFLVFQARGKQLKLQILDDDLFHLEWSGPDQSTPVASPIPVTPFHPQTRLFGALLLLRRVERTN